MHPLINIGEVACFARGNVNLKKKNGILNECRNRIKVLTNANTNTQAAIKVYLLFSFRFIFLGCLVLWAVFRKRYVLLRRKL